MNSSLVDIASDLTLSIEAWGFEKRLKEEKDKLENRLFFHTLEDDSDVEKGQNSVRTTEVEDSCESEWEDVIRCVKAD